MVVGLLLDVTLDIGYWVVKRVGYGVVGVARYIGGWQESDDQLLAIDGPPQVAGALDAAARLRAEGILDDESYVRIATDAVNLGTREPQSHVDKDQTPTVASSVPLLADSTPSPSAPPPYDGLGKADGKKRANARN